MIKSIDKKIDLLVKGQGHIPICDTPPCTNIYIYILHIHTNLKALGLETKIIRKKKTVSTYFVVGVLLLVMANCLKIWLID